MDDAALSERAPGHPCSNAPAIPPCKRAP